MTTILVLGIFIGIAVIWTARLANECSRLEDLKSQVNTFLLQAQITVAAPTEKNPDAKKVLHLNPDETLQILIQHRRSCALMQLGFAGIASVCCVLLAYSPQPSPKAEPSTKQTSAAESTNRSGTKATSPLNAKSNAAEHEQKEATPAVPPIHKNAAAEK